MTFDSKGRKKIVSGTAVNYKKYSHYIYGDRTYIVTYDKYSKKGKNERKLIVESKKGKILKKITLNISKYLKSKKSTVQLSLLEVKGIKKVRLSYRVSYLYKTGGYGGIIEVNTVTGKVKKLVSSNDFIPEHYDGKYVYGKSFEPDGALDTPKKVTFYMQSLKTGKITKFKTDVIPYASEKYMILSPAYSFYKGQVMGVEPDGKVYYGTFSSKKFEQVGDISGCKYFKQGNYISLRMKSKNEFYIRYDASRRRDEESDGASWGVPVIVKYKK